jgi:membrane protein
VLQWPLALLLTVVGLDLTYYLAPAARPRWGCPTPGAAFALGSWVLASLGLRLYVANLGDFNATYGSLGAVILLLLWLYLTAAALLVGGVINSVVAGASEAPPDSARAREEPRPDEPPAVRGGHSR